MPRDASTLQKWLDARKRTVYCDKVAGFGLTDGGVETTFERLERGFPNKRGSSARDFDVRPAFISIAHIPQTPKPLLWVLVFAAHISNPTPIPTSFMGFRV